MAGVMFRFILHHSRLPLMPNESFGFFLSNKDCVSSHSMLHNFHRHWKKIYSLVTELVCLCTFFFLFVDSKVGLWSLGYYVHQREMCDFVTCYTFISVKQAEDNEGSTKRQQL